MKTVDLSRYLDNVRKASSRPITVNDLSSLYMLWELGISIDTAINLVFLNSDRELLTLTRVAYKVKYGEEGVA